MMQMKIRAIRPCSENTKYMVVCDLGYPVNLRKICSSIRNTKKFKVIFFEKSNLAWIMFDVKRILIYESGKIIVNGADDVDDAIRIIKEIEKVVGNICLYKEKLA